MNREVSQRLEELSHTVIGAAIKVHSALGAGLLESAYEHCLLYELRKQGIHAMAQVSLPIYYDGQEIEAGYRIDLLVENDLIIGCRKPFTHSHSASTILLKNGR